MSDDLYNLHKELEKENADMDYLHSLIDRYFDDFEVPEIANLPEKQEEYVLRVIHEMEVSMEDGYEEY